MRCGARSRRRFRVCSPRPSVSPPRTDCSRGILSIGYAMASMMAFSVGLGRIALVVFVQVRVVVPAHIDRLALGSEQFGVDFCLILDQLLCDAGKSRLQFLVLRLRSQSLGPVHGQVEVAAAVVDLAYLARGRSVVVEELADRLVERFGQQQPRARSGRWRRCVPGMRPAPRIHPANPSGGSPPSGTAAHASAPSRRRRSRTAHLPRGAGQSTAFCPKCRSRESGKRSVR